jgi:hypothetical protein
MGIRQYVQSVFDQEDLVFRTSEKANQVQEKNLILREKSARVLYH